MIRKVTTRQVKYIYELLELMLVRRVSQLQSYKYSCISRSVSPKSHCCSLSKLPNHDYTPSPQAIFIYVDDMSESYLKYNHFFQN